MKFAVTLAAALFASTAAAALPAPSPLVGPEEIQAGAYTIDTKETLVRYATMHMGFNEFWGTFPGATGTLNIDPKAISATHLDVTVPVKTVSTTNTELDGQFISNEFFDAKTYPVMRFVSTDVERTGPATAKVTGRLTIHGVTRPVVLDVTFNAGGYNTFDKTPTIGFKGETVVNRSDFGLGKYVPIVSDATTITISAAFVKKKG